MKGFIEHGVAAAALALGAGSAHAAQFIVNGDFSDPDVGGGYTSTQAIPGWTNNAEAFVEVGSSPIYGLPCISTGCQNAEINNSTLGDVVQTVSGLIVGKTYDFSFDYGGRNDGGPQQLNTTVGSLSFVNSSDGVTSAWTLDQGSFTATSTTATVEFQSVNAGGSGGYGNEVTNVSLTGPAVPEPGTWAMMLLGLGMVGYGLRRRAAALSVSYS